MTTNEEQYFISCTEEEFQEIYKFVTSITTIRSINIIPLYFRPTIFFFYVKYHTDEVTDMEKELPKYTDYSQDINNILYEPTNITMTFFEIMKTPYILSTHIFNLADEPKFKIIFGKNHNYQTLYYVPKLNTFIKGTDILNLQFIRNCYLSILGNYSRWFIIWDNVEIEKILNLNHNKINSEICKICLENDINTLFQPCMHAISCQICSKKFNKCYVCKSKITDKIFLFKP
ncbi:hypothetical protein AGMMS49579_01050 [Spirochaetia bacterium]|nr:hypothetical protein AGMMS49579_01050 [Spirochaetia bacterium]